jgi:hypothetical protein
VNYEGVAKEVSYNPETGVFRWLTHTRHHKKGAVAGCKRADGYRRIGFNSVKYYSHRLAFFMMTGCVPDMVDHKDTVKDNNCWSNLRDANTLTNAWNHNKTTSKTTSRFTGVVFRRRSGKWEANVTGEGQLYYLGQYSTEIKAANASQDKAKVLFGKFYNNSGENV